MAIWSRRARRAPARASHPARRSTRTPVAITASASRLVRGDNDMLRRLQQGWQTRSFIYYETIGEVWYAGQFYARALSNLELYVGKVDPATGEIEKVEDAFTQGYVERIQDPGGGRSQLLGSYGRLQFLTGECYLLVTLNEETGEEIWEFLSTDELRPTGQGSFTRFKAPSLNAEEIVEVDDSMWEPVDGECVAYRVWRRHPRYSALADAPMRGILDLCEELLLLTMAVRSRALSRIPAGLLIIPDEVTLPAAEAEGEEDADEDPFLDDLEAHFEAPLQDKASASAIVPFIIRVGGDHSDKIRMVELEDPSKFYPETGLRAECIHRMALGLDLPPEVLLGTADANHWTSWQIDEQTWKAHLQPVAQTLVDDLTAAYLRPALRADGYGDWADYVVAYDASAIINHPDRTTDAKDLYKDGVISAAALREAAGFDETDAMTEAEWRRWAGLVLKDSSLAVDGIPSKLGAGGLEIAPGVIEKGSDAGGVVTPADTAQGPPDTEETAPQQPTPRTASASMLAGAIALAVENCRSLAGSRIISKAVRIDDAKALLADVPKGQAAFALGEGRCRSILPGKTPRELVKGGTSALASTLLAWGLNHAEAARVCQLVEQHAATTLWKERPGSPREIEP